MKKFNRNSSERGDLLAPVLILVALCIIIFVFIVPAQNGVYPSSSFYTPQNQSVGNSGSFTTSNPTLNSTATVPTFVRTSAYAGKITLGGGNGSSEIQPADEYITIYNGAQGSVDISGWTLTNSKGTRTYMVGSSEETFPSDRVTIPKSPGYVPASGPAIPQDIVLKPNDQAIVTTGSIGVTDPYKITSFKENECSGYLDALPDYTFTPGLNYACVAPTYEPGTANLDQQCRVFMQSLSSCQTPTYDNLVMDSQGNQNVCSGCVDKQAGLSEACVSFIKSHFSYGACLANHVNDPNFYGNTWRIFLGRTWELWATDHETISLYDQYGKLVDYLNY